MRMVKQAAVGIAVFLAAITPAEAQQKSASARASADALERLKAAGIIDETTTLQSRLQRSGETPKQVPVVKARKKPATMKPSGSFLNRLFQRESTPAKPKQPSSKPKVAKRQSPGMLKRFLGRETSRPVDTRSANTRPSTRIRAPWHGKGRSNANPVPRLKIAAAKPRTAVSPRMPAKTTPPRSLATRTAPLKSRAVDELQQLVDRQKNRPLPLITPRSPDQDATQSGMVAKSAARPIRSVSKPVASSKTLSGQGTAVSPIPPASWGGFDNPFTTRVTSEISVPVRSATSTRVAAPEPQPAKPIVTPRKEEASKSASLRASESPVHDNRLPEYVAIGGQRDQPARKEVVAKPSAPIAPAGSIRATQVTDGVVKRSQVRPATLSRVARIKRVPLVPVPNWVPKVTPAGSPVPSVVHAARRLTKEQKRHQIAVRQKLIGFKGFCPVELRNNRLLLTSYRQYSAKHGLRTYFFSSAAAVREFERNPTRYVPAEDGRDVVLKAKLGQSHIGKLDHAAWYDGRLYLFTSAETLDSFNENPARFAGSIKK